MLNDNDRVILLTAAELEKSARLYEIKHYHRIEVGIAPDRRMSKKDFVKWYFSYDADKAMENVNPYILGKRIR